MAYLIEVRAEEPGRPLGFDAVADDLEAVARHIQLALGARGCAPPIHEGVAGLRRNLPTVSVASFGAGMFAMGEGEWEVTEVYRQLCQVSVLIAGLRILGGLHPGGCVKSVSPTQQAGLDARGANRRGQSWALEAFGGVDVRNNDKAKRDASALLDWSPPLRYRYFACFHDAWRSYAPKGLRFCKVGAFAGPDGVAVFHVSGDARQPR